MLTANRRAPSRLPQAARSAAPAGGLSAEQREFLERKARESRSPAPAQVRLQPAVPGLGSLARETRQGGWVTARGLRQHLR